MSLQYIVDAYNLTNHPQFRPLTKHSLGIAHALADFISVQRLSGSKNNSVTLVFDGYPLAGEIAPCARNLFCVFSRMLEADEIIKKIVEESPNPRNIIVVSDDKEVQIAVKFLHAQVSSVQEFILGKKNSNFNVASDKGLNDEKLSFTKMQKINAELKKKWLE